jgi:hypothetical protein
VIGFGSVVDRAETVVEIDRLVLKKPELNVFIHKMSGRSKDQYLALISVTNPIQTKPLINCRIFSVFSYVRIESKLPNFSIKAGKKHSVSAEIAFEGTVKMAVFQMNCDNLHNVVGSGTLQVDDTLGVEKDMENNPLMMASVSKGRSGLMNPLLCSKPPLVSSVVTRESTTKPRENTTSSVSEDTTKAPPPFTKKLTLSPLIESQSHDMTPPVF